MTHCDTHTHIPVPHQFCRCTGRGIGIWLWAACPRGCQPCLEQGGENGWFLGPFCTQASPYFHGLAALCAQVQSGWGHCHSRAPSSAASCVVAQPSITYNTLTPLPPGLGSPKGFSPKPNPKTPISVSVINALVCAAPSGFLGLRVMAEPRPWAVRREGIAAWGGVSEASSWEVSY